MHTYPIRLKEPPRDAGDDDYNCHNTTGMDEQRSSRNRPATQGMTTYEMFSRRASYPMPRLKEPPRDAGDDDKCGSL